jgi:prepilin-type N-terminal cleavage/methylation domain-containing protein
MKKIKTKKGFTLIELMISIVIFLVMMVLVVEIFAKQVVTARHARVLQRNIEDAEFAMNYINKTLRTSTLPVSADEGNTYTNPDDPSQTITSEKSDQKPGTHYAKKIYAYDYSQNKCFKFEFKDGKLYSYVKESSSGEENKMNIRFCMYDDTFSDKGRELTSGKITGGFLITPTEEDLPQDFGEEEWYEESIGKVTTSIEIDNRATEQVKQGEDGMKNMIVIQSSVALRDYPGDITF